MQAVVSWSGGKDSCLAYYKAALSGIKVSYLLNLITVEGESYRRAHGLDPQLIVAQAQAIEVPITQKETRWETYEQGFKEVVQELKQQGIEAGVFGDISLQLHRNWIERVCADLEIKPLFPLWEEEPEQILKEFLDAGFEAIIVGVKRYLLSKKWLGHKLDREFIDRLCQLQNVHLCGENGEYHTFVINGPIFKRRMRIPETKRTYKQGCLRILDISQYELAPK
jgi:uncharacterized protein (TIGR00290 family)